MLPFDYYNPTRVVFGKNRIAELSRLIPAQSRVMVLYGGGSVRASLPVCGTMDWEPKPSTR